MSIDNSYSTDWLLECRYGVLTHFLCADNSATKSAIDAWNKRVNAFDVEGLAQQLEEVGAGYFILTIGQNSGYYCSPNATYDKIVGITPTKLSDRDLIADMATALDRRGIRLMAYLPSGAPEYDAVAVKRLCWEKGNHRLAEFQTKWEEVIREWSVRWGKKLAGWWIDGVYYADAMYRHDEEPNFASFTAALKAGNPDAIVAYNPGIQTDRLTSMLGSTEDYTAGEIAYCLPLKWPGRFVNGAQSHFLCFMGRHWAQGPVRFPGELVYGYTKYVTANNGVVTWDVPVDERGHIPTDFIRQLRLLKSLRTNG